MRLLAPGGASFFIVARNANHLEAVAQDLATRGAEVVYVEIANLDETAAHPAMLERAVTALGGLDCALIAHGTLGDQTAGEEDFATAFASFETNFLSAASLVTWLANYFAAQHHGTIAVISSVAGDRGRKSNYIYGSAKAGLNAFLNGVRNRVDREGVHVLTIRPGFVATPMTAHLPQGPLFVTPEVVARDILQRDRVAARCFVHAVVLALDHGHHPRCSGVEVQADGSLARCLHSRPRSERLQADSGSDSLCCLRSPRSCTAAQR